MVKLAFFLFVKISEINLEDLNKLSCIEKHKQSLEMLASKLAEYKRLCQASENVEDVLRWLKESQNIIPTCPSAVRLRRLYNRVSELQKELFHC